MATVKSHTSSLGPEAEHCPVERSLGLPQSTALIMGSIIGVGIFSLPYSLASYGPISLVAMGLATVGAVALAFMFAVMYVVWGAFLMAGGAFLLGIPIYLAQRKQMTEPVAAPPYS